MLAPGIVIPLSSDTIPVILTWAVIKLLVNSKNKIKGTALWLAFQ
jgi:hypothetical protein